MYEYHGWITLVSSLGEDEESDSREIIKKVEEILSPLEKERNGLAHMKALNGEQFVILAGHFNRASQIKPLLFRVFKDIAGMAPGSYGLLYVRDDEDMENQDNEFQVLRMARGSVNKCKDQYLSPCIPVIEDPFILE
ncbi:hypothetical protein IQ254_30370 [Nodosilinea sp. LEGE 07088]|uniref:Imm7 family immunity protein n=1 Tax=Nodosilinea sp. LEGE 07088 TaxID=2777968 RepID=UPI001881D33A|nr:Imm7 family immunity protein [Nodosilinea sp. LEGE 07088]MBE9141446.1 hypothetical protein [Nodosilinea sp. LEGE 07088]